MGDICKAIHGTTWTSAIDKDCTKKIRAYDKANKDNTCAKETGTGKKAICYKDKVYPQAPAPEGNIQVEAGAGLNASNPDIKDNSGGGVAIKQGGFGSRYQANDDFGGLTFTGSVVVTKPLSDTSKLRLGAKFNYTELNPYFDQYQDPMTPRLSRFAAMAVVGIEGKIAPNAFASADLVIGAVKTWAGEKDAKASFKTSDLAMATTKGTDLDKWALYGGLAARVGYNLSSRFYMALTAEVTVDSLSSDVTKNPESDKTFNVGTSGPTATVGAAVGAKF